MYPASRLYLLLPSLLPPSLRPHKLADCLQTQSSHEELKHKDRVRKSHENLLKSSDSVTFQSRLFAQMASFQRHHTSFIEPTWYELPDEANVMPAKVCHPYEKSTLKLNQYILNIRDQQKVHGVTQKVLHEAIVFTCIRHL